MQIDIPTLETARLSLIPPDRSHLDAYVAAFCSPQVMQHIDEPMTRPQVWQRLCERIGHWHLRGFGTWTIRDRASGTLCGMTGLKQLEGMADIEAGWLLLPDYWGRGLAREAAQAAIDDGFGRVGATRILARVSPHNAGSIAVARKIGLRHDVAASDDETWVFAGSAQDVAAAKSSL